MHRLLVATALAVALPVTAATVYKTVDAEGTVSYSDTPPPPGVASEVIETPGSHAGPDPDAAERLQQMRETTDRLREDRLARERARSLAQPPVPAPYAAPPEYPDEDDDDRWLVPYYPPYRRWHGDRPPPPRPPYVRPEPPPDNGISPRGLRQRIRATR